MNSETAAEAPVDNGVAMALGRGRTTPTEPALQRQQRLTHGCVGSGVDRVTAQRHPDTSRKELIMSTLPLSATRWTSSTHVLCVALVLVLTACSSAPTA